MSWVCSVCSHTNPDGATSCIVCDAVRPAGVSAFRRSPRTETADASHSRASDKGETRCDGFFASLFSKEAREKKRKGSAKKETRGDASAPTSVPSADKCTPFASPWAEHRIEFDADAIRARGFVRSERGELGGVKGYLLYREDGSQRFIRAEMVIALRMARKL